MKSIRSFKHIAVASILFIPAAAYCQTTAAAQPKETTIYTFTGTGLDGFQPIGPLVAQTNSTGQIETLYGVTGGGGSQAGTCGGDFGCGTIYQLSRPGSGKAWDESLLFTNFMQSNGAIPAGGLFLQPTPAGPVFFGTTIFGGVGSTTDSSFTGNGEVFTLLGNYVVPLWQFSGNADQGSPSGALITDEAAGVPLALYGTTRGGHSPDNGTVYRIGVPGGLSTIWSFSSTDGKRPLGALLADSTGALYGTTYEGGPDGVGTIFKLTPPHSASGSWTLQTLYSFAPGAGGANPEQPDALVMDASGALYGTALTGGSGNAFCGTTGCGVVYKLSPPAHGQTAWTYQILWTFTGGNDGAYPLSGVIMDRTGALYGLANGGGNTGCDDFQAFDNGCGAAYKLTPPAAGHSAWTETSLWQFGGTNKDGTNPVGSLIADSTGTLYGVAGAGGPAKYLDSGTVFQLTGTGYVP